MAVKEYWVGSRGPFIIDDTDTYPDGEAIRGFRTSQIRIDEAPSSPEDAARNDTVEKQAEIDQRYSLMVS